MSLWVGEFGDAYTLRQDRPTVEERAQVWKQIVPPYVQSILEVGANTGLNLEALGWHDDYEMYATEPNDVARELLHDVLPATHITSDYAHKLSWPDNHVDLVLTCGVLIHVPPEKLLKSMQEIHRVARRFILCAEYFAPREEMIPYRGQNDALWRRSYGELWVRNFGDLQCRAEMFCSRMMTGWDNVTIWVLEKGNRRH